MHATTDAIPDRADERASMAGDGVAYAVRELGYFPPGTVAGWFSRKEKAGRALWVLVESTVFRFSPKRADGFRAWLLRCFGATVHGRPQVLRRTVRIEVPWNIELGEGVQIGDHARLYSLGRIRIGAHSVVSQYAHLCAGTHDYTDTDFPLRRVPITIGERCWVATDVYVAPGVTIADGVVVGARSNVVKDLPAWTVCVGSPARPVRGRPLVDRATGTRLDPMEENR
ncbi:MAG: colanic acid biosynthesis acetyltransferase WcaF [Planctomycetota bacterium]|nr:MAG: colanic acid biosynthesis acetyltransferase WcaF [Planctomycetota bacterium]